MSERERADTGTIGVVAADATEVVEAVEAAGGRVRAGAPREVVAADPDVVVAVGEATLLALVAAGVDAPVLPVDADRGVRSIPRGAVEAAVPRLVAGEWTTVEHPLVAASVVAGARAMMDLMLVTAEPARISEFAVASRDERVARFRADGVVVATPAGSAGYARAAEGPVLAPGTGAVAVVPVAPFATDPDRWVLPVEGLELAVERDETTVHLLADGRTVGAIPPDDPVGIERAGAVRTAVVPESRPFFQSERL